MYSVQQLQALDCLLKKVVGDHFKLVIELNGQYWYGDFVRLDGNALYQHFTKMFRFTLKKMTHPMH